MKENALMTLLRERKTGKFAGIYSACTANELALEAVMEAGLDAGAPVLIEATANQVNQFGGYTGMTPADFAGFVRGIAKKTGFPEDMLILGGDHLGPLVWTEIEPEKAMEYSEELVRAFAAAGFTKLHLDTSMRLKGDDRSARLPDSVIAARAARLAAAAEEAFAKKLESEPQSVPPVYVIGSEVPIPGGAQEEEGLCVTSPADFEATLSAFMSAFADAGLGDAARRIVAIVVQPGVEFGDHSVDEYDREAARALCSALGAHEPLVFEGHSTDYQTRENLRRLVEDGVAILKVGPALTFALREGYFALEAMEKELGVAPPSRFSETLEAAMLKNPSNWKKHYHGGEKELAFKRRFSFSDRCRYYLPEKSVAQAAERLIENIDRAGVPLSLLSQYMPGQYTKVREGELRPAARELVKSRVRDCIYEYLYAVRGLK